MKKKLKKKLKKKIKDWIFITDRFGEYGNRYCSIMHPEKEARDCFLYFYEGYDKNEPLYKIMDILSCLYDELPIKYDIYISGEIEYRHTPKKQYRVIDKIKLYKLLVEREK